MLAFYAETASDKSVMEQLIVLKGKRKAAFSITWHGCQSLIPMCLIRGGGERVVTLVHQRF